MEINDQGVVNPLGPPRWMRSAVASFRRMPPVGRAFVGLALGDLVIWNVVLHASSWSAVASALTVLAPAASLWRTPDRSPMARLGFTGVALVAIAALGTTIVRGVSTAFPPTSDDVLAGPRLSDALIQLGLLASSTVGWVLVAREVHRTSSASSAWSRRIAFVAAALAVATGVGLLILDAIVSADPSLGSPLASSVVVAIVELSGAVVWFITAWIVWVFVSRGASVPGVANRSIAAVAIVWSFGSLPIVLAALVAITTRDDAWMGLQGVAIWVEVVASVVTAALFVVALASGLLDDRRAPMRGTAA
jgi:hypothetical protein